VEAEKLKNLPRTKIVGVGIGSAVNQTELNDIASPPQDENVFLSQDFNSLTNIRKQLINASCKGW